MAHGLLGHRWSRMQLGDVALRPTQIMGDADLARRMFVVTWHIVTSTPLASAITLFLAGVGVIDTPALLRFISVTHMTFLVIGATLFAPRLFDAFRAPSP